MTERQGVLVALATLLRWDGLLATLLMGGTLAGAWRWYVVAGSLAWGPSLALALARHAARSAAREPPHLSRAASPSRD